MQPNNQQPSNPDYSFILDQAGPPEPGSHKSRGRIGIVFGVVIVSVIVGLLFFVLIIPGKKTVDVSGAEPATSQKFVKLMAQNNQQGYTEATQLLSVTSLSGVRNKSPILQRINGDIDVSSCKFVGKQQKGFAYSCTKRFSSEKSTIVVSLNSDSSTINGLYVTTQ